MYIREYTSGNLRKNWNQGYWVHHTAWKYRFCPSLAAWKSAPTFRLFWLQIQLLNLAGEPDVYSLLLQFSGIPWLIWQIQSPTTISLSPTNINTCNRILSKLEMGLGITLIHVNMLQSSMIGIQKKQEGIQLYFNSCSCSKLLIIMISIKIGDELCLTSSPRIVAKDSIVSSSCKVNIFLIKIFLRAKRANPHFALFLDYLFMNSIGVWKCNSRRSFWK